ncbi:MAG TPA: response regulator [Chloroflexota bacterium]|nr:response regulator [Chloroflexota bacterium]
MDDDQAIRTFVGELLTDEGYEVRAVANGRQALGVLATWRPAVILLDLMMPEMDGWTFLAAQQTDAELVRIPVIVMSASYHLQGGADHLAAADVLAKPFVIEQLLSKVEALA